MKQKKEIKELKQTEVDLSVIPSESENIKLKPKLSEEAIQERALLEGMLIQLTEDNVREAKERRKRIEQQEIELRSGDKISIAQVKSVITALRQAYDPVFPNSKAFYKEIYRLNGWKDLNPNSFTKPTIVGTWTVEILYNRMGNDVFPTLNVLNPALPGGIRLHKCFQFLTKEGRTQLENYRDETIKLMQKCETWYEFRKLLFVELGIPYPTSLFDETA